MAQESNVRTRTVTDPLALRALAHPLRLELQGLVAREGAITAADAARQLGISQALASHHLRQLAKYGFVEPAESPDQRSRPWRVTSTSMQFRPEHGDGRAATEMIELHSAERAVTQLDQWFGRRQDEDPRWIEVAGSGQSLLYLTVEEMAEVQAALLALFAPWAERRPVGHADTRPVGAVPVSFTVVAVPLTPTEHGG